jgi:hypothetical protein
MTKVDVFAYFLIAWLDTCWAVGLILLAWCLKKKTGMRTIDEFRSRPSTAA